MPKQYIYLLHTNRRRCKFCALASLQLNHDSLSVFAFVLIQFQKCGSKNLISGINFSNRKYFDLTFQNGGKKIMKANKNYENVGNSFSMMS